MTEPVSAVLDSASKGTNYPEQDVGTERIRRQQVGMSIYDHNISPDAETRREGARQSDGRFGPQEHPEPAGGTDALVSTREQAEVSETGIIRVPVRNVRDLVADPVGADIWPCGPITEQMVLDEIATPTVCPDADHNSDTCKNCHARRIAKFVVDGLDEDDPHPIELDLGIGSYYPYWPILDGNHRVFAAIVRRDEAITVAGGGDWRRVMDVLIDGREIEL